MAKKAYTYENVTLFSERTDVRYKYYYMIIQNIIVCMQMEIVPTADPILPDCIAKNFAMYHVHKITAILVSGRGQNYTQVQRIYSALKQKCLACLYRATEKLSLQFGHC
jgi:hypothetical protein